MKKFIVLYHAPSEDIAKMGEPTPEQMQKGMESWMAWAKKCGDKLIDLGSPLSNGQIIKSDGNSEESTRGVCGYSVIAAEDLAEAESLLQDHPHLDWTDGCEIEIHETMPLPG